MMLMKWDVSLDLKTSKDGAHFMFSGMAFHSFGPRTAKEAIFKPKRGTSIISCCPCNNLIFSLKTQAKANAK